MCFSLLLLWSNFGRPRDAILFSIRRSGTPRSFHSVCLLCLSVWAFTPRKRGLLRLSRAAPTRCTKDYMQVFASSSRTLFNCLSLSLKPTNHRRSLSLFKGLFGSGITFRPLLLLRRNVGWILRKGRERPFYAQFSLFHLRSSLPSSPRSATFSPVGPAKFRSSLPPRRHCEFQASCFRDPLLVPVCGFLAGLSTRVGAIGRID